jgi:hypothetical protein
MDSRVRRVPLQALLGCIQLHHDAGKTLRQRIMDIPRETGSLGHNRAALSILGNTIRLEQPLQLTRKLNDQPTGRHVHSGPACIHHPAAGLHDGELKGSTTNECPYADIELTYQEPAQQDRQYQDTAVLRISVCGWFEEGSLRPGRGESDAHK